MQSTTNLQCYLVVNVRICLQCRRPQLNSWVRKMC